MIGRIALRVGSVVLAALVLPQRPVGATPHCNPMPHGDPATLLAADPDLLRDAAPQQAKARACLRIGREGATGGALTELGRALTSADEHGAAAELFDQLLTRSLPDVPEGVLLDLARADLAKATARWVDVAALADRALSRLASHGTPMPALLAEAQVMRAAAALSMRRKDGMATASQALAAAEHAIQSGGLTETFLMVRWLNQRTMLAAGNYKLDEIITYAERERDLVRRLDGPDSPAQMDALVSLGAVISMQRRYPESLVPLYEVRRIGRLVPGASTASYLGGLSNLSAVLIDLGRAQEALEASDEALDRARQLWGPGSAQTLTPLGRRHDALLALQRLRDARQTQLEILSILDRDTERVPLDTRMRLLDRAAGFFQAMNDLDQAEALVRQASGVIEDKPDRLYWKGRTDRRVGLLAMARGQWQEADAALARATQLLTPTYAGAHAYLTMLLAMRCDVQLRVAAAKATACLQLESQLASLDDGPASDRSMARRVLADHAEAQGREDQAFHHSLLAVAAAQSVSGRPQLWSALNALSRRLRHRKQPELAVVVAKMALIEIETVRQSLRSTRDLEMHFLKDKYDLYRCLADWLAEDGRLDEALEIQRLLKGEELRDYVRGRADALAAGGASVPLDALERRKIARLPPPEPAGSTVPPVDMKRSLAAERRAAGAWRAALAAGWTRPSGSTARRTGRAPRPWPVDPGELRATVFHGPAHLNIVVDTERGRASLRLRSDPKALSRDVGRLLARIELREDASVLLQDLHRRVAAPLQAVAEQVGATRWRLDLDGDLRYLPFPALHDGQQALIDRYTIVQQELGGNVGPSTPASSVPWLEAFGRSRAAPNLPALPWVTDEICSIVAGDVTGGRGCRDRSRPSAIPGRGWLDEAFTLERLRRGLQGGRPGRRDMLHIGTHFVLRPGEIGSSWLVLGDGSRLHLHELLGWSFESLELVTLAACQTGGGGGAEVEGLSAVLLQRGAGAVVGSLWQVDDRSTATLMREFYARMATSEDPAEALRQAQLRVRRSGELTHPAHWAAFFVAARGP